MKVDVSREELVELGISEFLADNIWTFLQQGIDLDDPIECWQLLVREVLTPYVPFPVHQFLHERISQSWDSKNDGPMPVWVPSVARQQGSNLATFMRQLDLYDYQAFYQWSITDRSAYWGGVIDALGIVFERPAEQICDLSQGDTAPNWLRGAQLNIADSCFLADMDQTAIVYRTEPDAPLVRVSYAELEVLVNRVANGLVDLGYQRGDGLAIDMIMNLESIAIYLGIVKAGCTVISIADSFTAPEIATRLRIGKAMGIFTMDHIKRAGKSLPMYEKVLEAEPPRVIVVPCEGTLSVELRTGDLAFESFLSDQAVFQAVPCLPHDSLNVLFSSGTTGDPKAIPWNHTTPIKAAADAYFHHDIHEQDVVCWPTNLGWMMGPWLLFATLINKGTIALYYQAPTGADFCSFVADAQVNLLGVVPSLVKAWRTNHATDDCDWHHIRAFSSTGECSSGPDMFFLMSRAWYAPVIEYCGGTEVGGSYLTGTVVQPAVPSTFTTPALGTELVILDENGQACDNGEVFLVPPSMGYSLTLLNKDHQQQYYQDVPVMEDGRVLRRHGDQVERLVNGYYRAHGRADDTMNLGGIKVSSAEIERVLKTLATPEDIAAVAVSPVDGGPSLLVIFVTVTDTNGIDDLRGSMQRVLSTQLNPLFKIHEVVVVDSLPRTASGKVMHRLLREQFMSRT